VRKKVFAYFLDNHHGDGIIAACVKVNPRAHARLIGSAPKRFFSPAYIGSRGYLGMRLDTGRVDWRDVAARVRASYRSAAPAVGVRDSAPTLSVRRPRR
jgi:phosphoribosylglycinamide formyltransferase-1